LQDGTDAITPGSMLALTDSQLDLVMTAAGGLTPEKRSLFLERVAARLELRGRRFTDDDLERAVRSALMCRIRLPKREDPTAVAEPHSPI
jgi:hypothetical protein